MTVEEVAAACAVQDFGTVARWCRAGRLEGARRIGRRWLVPSSAIEGEQQEAADAAPAIPVAALPDLFRQCFDLTAEEAARFAALFSARWSDPHEHPP